VGQAIAATPGRFNRAGRKPPKLMPSKLVRAYQRGAVLRLHFGLTDPISLERGIGSECFGHIAPELRTYVARQREAVA
jgi:hypothetical protein